MSAALRDEAQPVTQPLHQRARDERAAFQRVRRRPRRVGLSPASRRRSPAARASRTSAPAPTFISRNAPVPKVHFASPGLGAVLAEQRRLLIARDARDRNAVGQAGHALRLGEPARRGADLGQHRRRHAEQRAQLGIEAPRPDVEQQRARRVGDVGRVRLAARQPPDQEAVDGAERDLAAPRRARAGPRRCPASTRSSSPRSTDPAPGPSARARAGSCPAAFSSAHIGAVRRSCQTMALPTGRPSARSHSSVVSRWLVMPMAAIRLASKPLQRVVERARDRRPDRLRIVLDLARARVDLGELAVAARAHGARCCRAAAPSSRWFPGRWRESGLARQRRK